MKKIFFIIAILLCISFLFTGCKPEHMSDETYKLGLRALDTADKFFEDEISATLTHLELDYIYDMLKDEYYNNGDDLFSEIQTLALQQPLSELAFRFELYSIGSDDYSYTELVEGRNKIAETLNESKR